MSRRLLGVAVAVAAALALAACGDDSGSSSATTGGAGTTAAASATTAAGGAATTAASSGAATSAAAASGSATLATADNATLGQQILVNSAGMTVYLFEPDATATTSAVPAGIKANWPPVVADGTPVAGDGIDASKLGVAPQADGTRQVTYNGHLLYTFISDVAPGDAKGQGLGDVWYVVTPAGEKFEPGS